MRPEPRALLPAAGLLAAAALLQALHPGARAAPVLAGAALLLALLWLLWPAGLARLQAVLQRLALALAAALSFVVLAAVYFGALTPVALLLRVAGRDVLAQRRARAGEASAWQAPAPRRLDDNFFRDPF